MAIVMLFTAVTGFCGDLCASESSAQVTNVSGNAQIADLHAGSEKQCPCPAGQGTDSHRCDSSCDCDCPCHAPLTQHSIRFDGPGLVVALVFHEPFKHLPEVFLPKFIPPQNKA